MTPKEYLDRYTYLSFYSPFNNELVRAGISGYGSGWGSRGKLPQLGKQCQQEYGRFVKAVRAAHHGNDHPCGAKFYFDQRPLGLISRQEEFYADTFTRAFCGKGSPDEITDTLRIALAVGRIGMGKDRAGHPAGAATVADYASKFMTIDCNALVGNFYGGNPDNAIGHYAAPGRARKRGSDVRAGDAIVTHCTAHKHEHVGLIQDWFFDGSTARVRIVEWGEPGDQSKHYTQEARHKITTGPERGLGVGWETTSSKGGPSFRYIFAPSDSGKSHGWS